MADVQNQSGPTAWLQSRAPGFLFLFVLSLLYALPLFLDGRYYLDDLPHAMNGLTLWEQDGRPLASIISSLASFQIPSFTQAALIDNSPLPQILGLAALAFAAARLARTLFDAPPNPWQCLVVFPIIASPFMLQNLSYKFDALTMGLAVMLAIFASLNTTSNGKTVLVGAIQLLGALCLYQAAINIFVATTALLCLAFTWNNQANLKTLITGNIAKIAVALLVYGLILWLAGGLASDYAQAHSKLVTFDAEGLATILFNFEFGNFFVSEFLSDAPLLAVAGAASILLFSIELIRLGKSGQPVQRALIAVLGAIVLVLSLMGILLVLKQPVVRPRTLLALSILLVYAGYAFYQLVAKGHWLWRASLVVSTLWYFSLAYGLADAAHDQTRFDNFIASSLVNDLQHQGFKHNDRLAFDGSEPRAPTAQNASRSKLIARILQMNINGNSEWGFRLLQSFGLSATPVMDADDAFLKAACQDAALTQSDLYQLFKKDQLYLVSFRGGVCFKP